MRSGSPAMRYGGWLAAGISAGLVIAFYWEANQSDGRVWNPAVDAGAVGDNHDLTPTALRVRAVPIVELPFQKIDGLVELTKLKRALIKAAPCWPDFKIYKATHALELWGKGATFPAETFSNPFSNEPIPSGETLLNVLLDERAHQELSPYERPLCYRTNYGVSVRTAVSDYGAEGSTAHVDSLLSVLAENGVRTSTPLIMSTANDMTVRDLVTATAIGLSFNNETEWTLNALCRYLPPITTTWQSATEGEVSLDRIAQHLLTRPLGVGSCYGTHVLYSLCVAYRIDGANAILSPTTRTAIEQHFVRVNAELRATQTPRGSWPKRWAETVEDAAIESRPNMPSFRQPGFQELSSTSHHLDWIAIAPENLRPKPEAIQRAANYLVDEVLSLPSDKSAFFYIQITHGLRGVCVLSGFHPAVIVRTHDQDILRGNLSKMNSQ